MSQRIRLSLWLRRASCRIKHGASEARRHVHSEQMPARAFSWRDHVRQEATIGAMSSQMQPRLSAPSRREDDGGRDKKDQKPHRPLLKSFTNLRDLVKSLEPYSTGEAEDGYIPFRGIEASMALNHLHRLRFQSKDDVNLSNDFKRQIQQFARIVMKDIRVMKGKNLSWTLNALKDVVGFEGLFETAADRLLALPANHFESLQTISSCCSAFAHSVNSKRISPDKMKKLANHMAKASQCLMDYSSHEVDFRSIAILCNAFAKLSPETDEVFDRASKAIQLIFEVKGSMRLQDISKICHAFSHRLTYDRERDSALFGVLFSAARSEIEKERKRILRESNSALPTHKTRCCSSCLLHNADNVGCLPVDLALVLQSLVRSQHNDLEILAELKDTIEVLSLNFPQHFDGMSIQVILSAFLQFRVCDDNILTAIARCIIASEKVSSKPEAKLSFKTIRTWLEVATDYQIQAELLDTMIEMAMEMIANNMASISKDDSHALVRAITERGAEGPLMR